MKKSKLSTRLISIFYRFVLPACISILLFIVSPIQRPMLLGTQGFDFFIRFWIVFTFCLLYVRLADLERYMLKTYGITIDHSRDHELPLNWRNVFQGILLGVVSIPIVWWIIETFLPTFSEINWLLTLAHGVIISIPLIIWRNELVM